MSGTPAPVVLATCAELPGLHDDEEPLLEALADRDVPVRICAWDDPSVDWSDAALVVIRSTWDYVPRRTEFVAWAARVSAATALWNPAEVVAWNTDKTYLRELAQAGVATVPTRWLRAGSTVRLAEVLDDAGWETAVVKPVVSAGAIGTVRFRRDDAADVQDHLAALLAGGAAMLQPYVSSVETAGEISVMWIDGELTHAVRKRPAAGDFRIQKQFGGTYVPIAIDSSLRDAATRVLAHVDGGCRYARVDLVIPPRGEPLLIELELVEPQLFLRHCPDAAARLAEAIAGALTVSAEANPSARRGAM